MDTIRGTVHRVIYTNETNTYTVFLLRDYDEDTITCVTYQEAPREGDELELAGQFVEHPKYGHQFKVKQQDKVKPDTLGGAKQYLLNLGVKGFGEKSVDKVIAYFEDDILSLLKEENPVAILEVPHLRKSVKQEVYDTLRGEGALQDINHFLDACGLSPKWSRILFQTYGLAAVDVLKDNPYVLLTVDTSMHFSVADRISSRLGLSPTDTNRLEAGIRWLLRFLSDNGHTCYPMEEFIPEACHLLGDYADEIVAALENMLSFGELYLKAYDGMQFLYTPSLYIAETEGVRLTEGLKEEGASVSLAIEAFLSRFEEANAMELSQEQRAAISLALEEKVALITGGPGTGKTTIIKVLVDAFQESGLSRILLCAPTGRAAKRLSEATGSEATTIHRLLMPVQGSEAYDFLKNEDDPLEADVVIIDEASMLNIQLYYSLVSAIPPSCHVIIVGDVDQLPPIGAGFVLRDILDSQAIPYQRLTQIYRQQKGNRIVENAHRINAGQMPILDACDDFSFHEVHTVKDMLQTVIALYQQELQLVDDELDAQIISPMRKGSAGSTHISEIVQAQLNPLVKGKTGITVNGVSYRVGDKVIQVTNDYDLDVFNGEIGSVFAVSKSMIQIRFPDKEVKVPLDSLPSIRPAYAITVHKSQGSEYDVVIIPFIPPYGPMLQRNLLYTAITRARRKVILVGTESAIERAVNTVEHTKRYSLFKERLQHKV